MNKLIVFGLLSAIILAGACFFPWVTVESKSIVVSGVEAEGTNFGKPGYLHFIFIGLYIIFLVLNRLWSRRVNLFISTLNLTWAVRNFILISTCRAGECPEKHIAIYIMLISSIAMIVPVLFADAKIRETTDTE